MSLIEFAASSDHVNPFSITHEDPERIIISNVAGEGAHQLLVNWTSIFDAEPLWLRGDAERCGVRNLYERPEQLGPDRWAALIAARALHPGAGAGGERRHRHHRRHAVGRRALPRRRDPARRRADALRAARAHRPPAAPGGQLPRPAAQHRRRDRDRLPPCAGRRGRAHVPRVARRRAQPALHRRRRRRTQR